MAITKENQFIIAGRMPAAIPPLPPERYQSFELDAGSSPLVLPEEYHSVIRVYTAGGPTTVVLPDNLGVEPRIVTVVDENQQANVNPITIEWQASTLFLMNKPGLRMTFIFNTVANEWSVASISDLSNLGEASYFAFGVPVNVAGIFPFAALVSPFGPNFKFNPFFARIKKSVGTWNTAPSLSLGSLPAANNIMGNQNLTTQPNVVRGTLQSQLRELDGDIYYRVHQAGVTSSGTPAVDILLAGAWLPQSFI